MMRNPYSQHCSVKRNIVTDKQLLRVLRGEFIRCMGMQSFIIIIRVGKRLSTEAAKQQTKETWLLKR